MTDTPELSVDRLLAERGWLTDLARSLVRDPASADDVAQRSWLAALRAERRPLDPRAWLATIVHNEARQAHRTDARRRTRERAAAARTPTEAPSAAEAAERFDTRRQVVAAVDGLEEPFRSTVLLHHFEGVSLAEIARRTGTPDGTVRWRLHRAHQLLRAALEERLGAARWREALVAACIPTGGRFGALAAAGFAMAVVLVGVVTWWSSIGDRVPLRPEAGRPETAAAAVAPEAGAETDRRAVTTRVAATPDPSDPPQEAAPTTPAPVRDEFAIVRARLVDRAGAPLADGRLRLVGVRVGPLVIGDERLRWLLPPADADAEGLAVLPLRTPRALLEQTSEDHRPGRDGIWKLEFAVEAPGCATRNTVALVRDGDTSDLGTFALPPAVALEGRVLDADGKGLNDASVALEYGAFGGALGTALARLRTPESPAAVKTSGFFTPGSFRFDVVAAEIVRLTVSAAGHQRAFRVVDVADLGDAPLTIRLERTTRPPIRTETYENVEVRVLDAEGQPWPRSRVQVWVGGASAGGSTDDRGRYRMPKLAGVSGSWRVFATDAAAAGDATFAGSAWRDDVDPSAPIEIRLAPQPTTRLIVTDTAGQRLAGATAFWSIDDPADPLAAYRTDERGRCVLHHVGRRARLVVERDGYARSVGEPVEPAAAPAEQTVTLSTIRGVTGVVVDAEGRPVAGAEVIAMKPSLHESVAHLRNAWERCGPTRIDSDAAGRFAVFPRADEPLAPQLRLKIRHPDFATTLTDVFDFEPGRGVEGLRITLDAGGALRGIVRRADGAPVPNRQIAIHDGNGDVHRTITDANGRYALERVRAAAYEVVLPPARTDWSGTSWMTLPADAAAAEFRTDVTVTAGETVEHDIVVDSCRVVVRVVGDDLDGIRAGVATLCRAHDRAGVSVDFRADDGAFVLTSHATGPHRLRIVHSGRDGADLAATADLDLEPGERELVLAFAARPATLPAPPVDGYRSLVLRTRRGDFDVETSTGVRPGDREARFALAPAGTVELELRSYAHGTERIGSAEIR